MRRYLLAFVFTGLLIAGCTYYQTGPGTYVTTPASSFDRS